MLLRITYYALAFNSVLLFGAKILPAECQDVTESKKLKPPVLASLRVGDKTVTGTVSNPPPDSKVIVCIGDQEVSGYVTDDGHFGVNPASALEPGQLVKALVTSRDGTALSAWSESAHVLANCALPAVPIPGQAIPVITRVSWDDGHHLTVRGKIGPSSKGKVRVCIGMEPLQHTEPADVDNRGQFVISGLSAKEGDEIAIQIVAGEGDDSRYQSLSAIEKVPKDQTLHSDGLRSSFIGGIEQSGFSSLTQNTGAFVQVYLEGPAHFNKRYFGHISPWGRVRLVSAPQPSTNGIGSTFTDPTGQIMKADFTKVGQSVDFAIGIQKFMIGESYTHGRAALIASFGATTPLSSQDIPLTFKPPAARTAECTELLRRFSPKEGYTPGLSLDPTDNPSCLSANNTKVTDIAFANQDRSNLLMKWGAGVRAIGTGECTKSYAECAAGLGLLDVTVGQDSTMTKGQVRNFVFKIDGQLPIKTGDTSYLYLFGAAYMRLKQDREAAPLILESEKTPPIIPSAASLCSP